MSSLPWDSVPEEDVLFFLVTGANSGVGLATCLRVADEFLASRSLSSHLVLIPTTRTAQKSRETARAIKSHVKKHARTSKALRGRAGGAAKYDPRSVTRRVHTLPVQLDLCSLASIASVSELLLHGELNSLRDDDDEGDGEDFVPLSGVRLPRIDVILLNAGLGGWYGINWLKVVPNFLRLGIIQSVTWPEFKGSVGGWMVNPITGQRSTMQPGWELSDGMMGEVFCANVFGHYVLVHHIAPLMRRPRTGTALGPARILWESSVEPQADSLSFDDFHAVKTLTAYESTKRQVDLLALTAHLPSTRAIVEPYLRGEPTNKKGGNKEEEEKTVPPNIYLVHPGIVVTTVFPLNAFLTFWYWVVLQLARYLGSPWHTVGVWHSAAAPAWAALEEQSTLDALRAERVKWGSARGVGGGRWDSFVKATEVDGYGWEGRVVAPDEHAAEAAKGLLRRAAGRKTYAADATRESIEQFEADGVRVWRELERLRVEWEGRLKDATGGQ